MDLPNGWVNAPWSDIVMITHGQNQKSIEDPNGIYPIYGSGGQIGKSSRYLCKAGSTIVGRKGTINKPFYTHTNFWNIDTAFGITPHDGVLPKFLYLFCTHFNFTTLDHSTGRPSLTQANLYKIEMPLPPLAEQCRIVAKIDALFSELDKGVEMLQTIRQQLRTYRQAVLKWAFEGKFINIEITGVRKLEELCFFITKGTTPSKSEMTSNEGEVPFIKVYNLTFGGTLDFSINPTFVNNETHSGFLARSKVYPSDVLMNIVGPPLGKVSIVPDKYAEWNINQAIARFRCNNDLNNKYLTYYLLNQKTIETVSKKSKATAGQFNLTLEICRNIEIPYCSLEEQIRIVDEIESRLSVCDKLEQIVDESLNKARALKQSILKKAFAGQLAPQDPNDEPAEKLLERIKQAQSVKRK